MHALAQLAEFVSGHPAGALPDRTREAISLLLLDLFGATAAGLNSPLASAARQAASDAYGKGDAQVWLTGARLSPAGAAMANSAAASALDIDDGHRGAAGHAGAGVIPAALAVGQVTAASDADILDVRDAFLNILDLHNEYGLRHGNVENMHELWLRLIEEGDEETAERLMKAQAAETAGRRAPQAGDENTGRASGRKARN